MSAHTPVVFACRDHMMGALIDRICDEAARLGARIVRGRMPAPGEIVNYTPAECDELLGDADVAVFCSRSMCTRELMARAPRLRAVVCPSIGVDSVDIPAASELGILVANGAVAGNYVGMADASVMLMLNLLMGLRQSEEVLAGTRPRPAPEQRWTMSMTGKKVGLVGWGNIGRSVAARLAPFDCELLVHSAHAKPQEMPAGVRLTDLETLLRTSDIVGIFVALNAGTHHLINERTLALMKPTAFLVNVSRGDAVDEPALIEALRQGRIAGAALDTFAVEPLPMDSPLRQMRNVILTPHLVGQTREGYAAAIAKGVENIQQVLRGVVPDNTKNPQIAQAWRDRWKEHHV